MFLYAYGTYGRKGGASDPSHIHLYAWSLKGSSSASKHLRFLSRQNMMSEGLLIKDTFSKEEARDYLFAFAN